MATRRPASSRSRMPPPANPPIRSRSVLSKPISQPPSSSSSELGDSAASRNQEGGTNIQVVVRCRRRSDREIQENSPIIVTSAGAKSKEVSIETGSGSSSLGVVTMPPTRTYPFDLVFGPEADQAMVYHEVVSPMLEQVLQGYNCTLFAYGQTGTGKTYTMQGDLARTPMGNPSAHAGMIPRVLFRLFHQLETSSADYSVKISFVELYNEELRDLLASELSAPSGSTQPMGMASKDKQGEGGLKIFDDSGKKGVFIQGLEEIAVKDSRDALALLVKGSERRQSAATNFNEHSSRSHSVFSITVHTKDTSFGEDLLKTGKLHLVDLAGSENIGRSGAENKRAREAGMINQSLLTLGRVINALVDKAHHVPYRESKLTRLLQDSLGGRTKTCIIATISPARSNLEETLSTLDYALRAKSIKNKPELNQRMTRNALLKEYVAEIDRLKADLLAAREKNGFYISEDSWKEMETKREMRETELVEAKKQVQIVEGQLRNVQEEYDQSIGLLMQREDELKQTRGQLSAAKEKLAQQEKDLQATKVALKEEELVRKAYQDSERNLNGIATGLKSTVTQSTRDVEGLHAKLERKNAVLSSNRRTVNKYGKETLSSANSVSTSIDTYVSAAADVHHNLANKAEEIIASESESLSNNLQALEKQGDANRHLFQRMAEDDEAETRVFAALEQDLQKVHSAFEMELTTWRTTVKDALQVSCGEIGAAVEKHNVVIEQSVDALQAALDDIVRRAKQYLQEQRHIIAEMKESADSHAASEIARLKKENEWLSKLVDKERKQAEASKDNLIQRISGLLGNFLDERDASLRASVKDIQQKHDQHAESSGAYFAQQDKRLSTVGDKSKVFETSLQQASREGKRKREAVGETVKNTQQLLDARLSELQGTTGQKVEGMSVYVRQHGQRIMGSLSTSLEEQTRIKRARIEKTESIQAGLESEQELVQSTLNSTYQAVEGFASQVISNVATLEDLASKHQETSRRNIDALQRTAGTVLEKGAKEDQPTGQTPQKRQWNYVSQWQLTQERDEILHDWRVQNGQLPVQEPQDDSASDTRTPPPELPKPRVSSGAENSIPVQRPMEKERSTPPVKQELPIKTRESLKEMRSSIPVETLAESRKRNVSTRSRRQ
ncbi:kinesin [Coprinopsis cinerea AmutBmut pab1-1]|nr:kinesin [Coprinopsis cinerea AmutBmut pab1-1]